MGKNKTSGSRNLLLLEKMPYLFTVLFALIGWAVVHIVDRAEKTPTIEFTTKTTLRHSETFMNTL
jgi:hypothetical protein